MRIKPVAFALILGTAGCAMLPADLKPPASTHAYSILEGRLDPRVLHRFRRVQTDVDQDVAKAATVSLIQPGVTPTTVAAAVTDSSGGFAIKLGGSFKPAVGTVFYLEAVKGLNSNQAGSNAARVRTLLRVGASGWESMTGSSIGLSLETTAISAAAQINTTQGATVELADLMGKLAFNIPDEVTPSTFTPVANLSVADYHGAYAVVSAALGGDLDPIASIDKTAGAFYLKSLAGIGVQPGLGADLGDTVTLSGTTFEAQPEDNVVRFNGVPATVTGVAGDRRSIQVTVPDGAKRGPVTLALPSKAYAVADYPIFGTVRLTLTGIPGATATASAVLTPASGPAVAKSVASPVATSSLVFKGLTPGDGWTFSATAVNAGNQVWAGCTKINGPFDPLTMTTPPISGPFSVGSGLNEWGAGLRVAPITGTASSNLPLI